MEDVIDAALTQKCSNCHLNPGRTSGRCKVVIPDELGAGKTAGVCRSCGSWEAAMTSEKLAVAAGSCCSSLKSKENDGKVNATAVKAAGKRRQTKPAPASRFAGCSVKVKACAFEGKRVLEESLLISNDASIVRTTTTTTASSSKIISEGCADRLNTKCAVNKMTVSELANESQTRASTDSNPDSSAGTPNAGNDASSAGSGSEDLYQQVPTSNLNGVYLKNRIKSKRKPKKTLKRIKVAAAAAVAAAANDLKKSDDDDTVEDDASTPDCMDDESPMNLTAEKTQEEAINLTSKPAAAPEPLPPSLASSNVGLSAKMRLKKQIRALAEAESNNQATCASATNSRTFSNSSSSSSSTSSSPAVVPWSQNRQRDLLFDHQNSALHQLAEAAELKQVSFFFFENDSGYVKRLMQ